MSDPKWEYDRRHSAVFTDEGDMVCDGICGDKDGALIASAPALLRELKKAREYVWQMESTWNRNSPHHMKAKVLTADLATIDAAILAAEDKK